MGQLFEKIRSRVEDNNNSNLYYNRLDIPTRTWINAIIEVFEEELEKRVLVISELKQENIDRLIQDKINDGSILKAKPITAAELLWRESFGNSENKDSDKE